MLTVMLVHGLGNVSRVANRLFAGGVRHQAQRNRVVRSARHVGNDRPGFASSHSQDGALTLLHPCAAFLMAAVLGCSPLSAAADAVYVPGPRIDIPALTPQVFAAIEMRRRATHFIRRDDGPRYVIYGAGAKTPPFPPELTAARGRSYIDGFAQVAPTMNCRTDDVADAYEFLLQAALLAYNGTHFERFAPGPVIACGARSFGAVSLDENVHIFLGGTAGVATLSDREKQYLYETCVVIGGYLLDRVAQAKPGSLAMKAAKADAADVVRTLTGFRASRVHLSGAGLSIDDQAR
jgi:hypothetical protein